MDDALRKNAGGWRVLHVITRLDLGGSAENTILTAIHQARAGHHVGLACGISDNPSSRQEARARELGVEIHRVRHLVRRISPAQDLLGLFQLFVLMRRGRYDLVHTHTSKAGILGRMAARLAGVKRIVHTPHGHCFFGYSSPWITGILAGSERFCMTFTDAQITLSRNEKEEYLLRGIGPAQRIHLIPSGVELPTFSAATKEERLAVRKELGLGSGDFVAGTVARLVSVKNHDLILRAAGRLLTCAPEVRFVFVGDGELRRDIEETIDRLSLRDHVVLTGWRDDVPRLLSAFDIFVMCSLNEGMGRAFVEAQAAGLPVIGSRVAGIPEVIQEGVTGYLVDPRDPGELAAAIQDACAHRSSASRIAAACRRWVDPRFSIETMIAAIDGLYARLLEPTP